MSWFEEQLKYRMEQDDAVLEESLQEIAGAVMGRRFGAGSDEAATRSALEAILRYHHIKPRDIPDQVRSTEDRLEYLLRPHGIMRRIVHLSEGWYKDASGILLAVRTDHGNLCALVPGKVSGYTFFNEETGKRERIGKHNAGLFTEDAIAFYRPFPLRKMRAGELVRFMLRQLSGSDIGWYVCGLLAVLAVGAVTPELNRILFSDVIEAKSTSVLAAMFIFMLCTSLSNLLLQSVSNLLQTRIETKLSVGVESAGMMRILSLPADFFKKYSAGELSNRLTCLKTLCTTFSQQIFGTGLSGLFSLVYIVQIFAYAPALAVPALSVTLLTVIIAALTALWQMRIARENMELDAQENGMSYALISGIQKIKLAGAEKRAFARWGRLYSRGAKLRYSPPKLLTVLPVITQAIGLCGTLFLYSAAIRTHVSAGDYYAFHVVYGMVAGGIAALSGIAMTAAEIRPGLEMVQPILDAVPEIAERKQVVTRLSGAIELNNVTFRYTEGMPPVIDDLTLKIRPGQYVAIVGATGCGKSTLMRLLLGFEKPQKGAVYYDGKDLAAMDLRSLRRKIGVVMQDGKLFQGDIFSNITISAPDLTLEQAWEAAETAGIADDIRAMPMGMFTVLSEGQGGISGGQRQRLMIARAVASKPRILMFDEATSALDNMTQKKVIDALDQLKCTRIVIAHRLSTIRSCDRILVMEHGKIAEEGGYDDLLAQGGLFAELVKRQQI